MRLGEWAWVVSVALTACGRPTAGRATSEGGAAGGDAGTSSVRRLLELENRRTADPVTADDLGDHDRTVRREATRALARLRAPTSAPMLMTALSDEDQEVMAWAAYGLGDVCRTDVSLAPEIVKTLVVRAATRIAGPEPVGGAALDPDLAIARALGRCATEDAEKTLVAWLSGPRPRAAHAALGLGDIASRKKALGEPTQLALLAAASSGVTTPPLPEALYAFGRLEHPVATAGERLIEVATARLADPGPARVFAVRALARAGNAASSELGHVLATADTFTAAERAEAARGLGRLGDDGQRALALALAAIVPARDPLAMTALATSAYGPLLVAMQTLAKPDLPGMKKLLFELAALVIPSEAPASLARRLVTVRCRAAALLVNGAAEDPLLLRCDPDEHGEIGEKTQLEVLGRRGIRGRRLALYRNLLGSKHVRVREAALDLLGAHAEVEGVAEMMATALAAQEPGMVATAATFIAAHPDRVTTAKTDLRGKLEEAIGRAFAPDDVETVGALIEAIGAARVNALIPKVESYCTHVSPTLREHAARALSLLKSVKTSCTVAAGPAEAATELDHLVPGPIKLELETDAGRLALTLDPLVAPVAVTRFADLARTGFFDGIVFHRVVPGFVVQFGDPGGDGFGGPGKQPLRCETSPLSFGPLDVGVGLAGRDTGSSQLFVTLARYPHLDGDYPLVGRASGDWDAIAEGDVIRGLKVVP